MDNLTAARTSMGVSLAFHIIFAALGVGLPVLLLAAEGLGLRNRDATWYALARRWGKAFGVLFVVGAVSGTTLSFEFGLLWPRFMGFASAVIGLPFALEGFAFFLEAIFLGLYFTAGNASRHARTGSVRSHSSSAAPPLPGSSSLPTPG
jgi:cytochrome d ubiquinol oxidase subunit I